jgi:hypothetical protein
MGVDALRHTAMPESGVVDHSAVHTVAFGAVPPHIAARREGEFSGYGEDSLGGYRV